MTQSEEVSTQPAARPLEPHPVAIVVGASSGIGAALVKHLAKKGYHVAALARREDKLAELSQSIQSQTIVKTIPHDVTNYDEIPTVFGQIVDELGGLDVIIYAAGVMPSVGPDEYDFDKDQQQVE
ncbi:MAG: SDR family NAD(P)-dependent oxidoreductase, partial [Chloroflexota bacterium]